MSYSTIIGLSMVVVTLLMTGGGLVYYMANLVRNAYALKVDMQNNLQGGLDHIENEFNKKTKWMRSELSEDVNRMKAAVQQDIESRLGTITAQLQKVVTDLDAAAREERADLKQTIVAQHKRLQAIEDDLNRLRSLAPKSAGKNQPGSEQAQPESHPQARSIRNVTLEDFDKAT